MLDRRMLAGALGTALLLGAPQTRASAPAAGAQDEALWQQWRGPARDGRVGGETWPKSLDEDHLRPRFRVEMGPSYSGPVFGPGRVFTTASEEGGEVVRCFDRDSGELLWEQRWKGSMQVPFFAARNGSWIRSTPAFDGEALYVAGMRDVLVRLDGETGDVDWRVDFCERYGTPLPDFGFVCSPLVDGEFLYVQAGASLVKMRCDDGSEVWRSLTDDGGMLGSAFSSPVLAELPVAGSQPSHGPNAQEAAGRVRQLLVQTRAELCGVDPETGARLWKHEIPTFRGMNILTPTVWNDRVFTSAYGGRAHLFGMHPQEGGGLGVEELWSSNAQGYMTSPVVVGDHAYLFLRSNRAACVDLASGETTWTSPPTGHEYWSMIAQGDRLLVLSNTGELLLLAADPTAYTELDRREVAQAETWAHLAWEPGVIAIREQGALRVFDWSDGG